MTSPIERGRKVAALLEGAWRASPPPLAVTPAEVAEISPLLLATGAGALAFSRLRRAGLASGPEAFPFQQAYRLHALESVLHEQRIPQAFACLRAAGLDPLLGKGWGAARLYPETGLRPYGDIDLFVAPGRHAAAAAALRAPGVPPLPVDLHDGFGDLDDREGDALLARARTLDLGGVGVRVFAPEDHLRLLGLHALRHGVSRPLWLCDVAALVEAEGAGLDWDYLLQGRPRRTEAVKCALGLASRLLGAGLDGAPSAVTGRELPSWLVPAVLRQWGRGSAWRNPSEVYLRRPSAALGHLHRHWPDPVSGTMGVGAPFNEWPRLPFQLAYATVRFAGALRRIWRGR